MRNASRARLRAVLFSVSALSTIAVAISAAPAAAQERAAEYDFDIPAQSLSRTVSVIAERAGLEVLYPAQGQNSAQAGAVRGRMSADAALARALAGTGYTYHYTRPGVITLERVPAGNAGDGELVTGVVSVEGYQGSPYFGGAGVAAGVNGINGSRDITATEGTGSYTSGALTIGSKFPLAIKDLPQTVSVVTQERLQDQNLDNLYDALAQTTGLTQVTNTSISSDFYSRGFLISSLRVDGGAPRHFNQYINQIDMAQYDHVELLRGSAGTFTGFGNPGGTINLVRKRPLDHGQVIAEISAGSWNNYRGVLDVSSPVGFDGKLRGRAVAVFQDRDFFYEIPHDNKVMLYGILEAELSPTTILSGGISYTQQDNIPWTAGLPRYKDGGDLMLPRSTALTLPWTRWNVKTTEFFGQLEQSFGEDWKLKANVTRFVQRQDYRYVDIVGGVDPYTKVGSFFYGQESHFKPNGFSADASLSGSFGLFGNEQVVVIGADWSKNSNGPHEGRGSLFNTFPAIDIFNYDPYAQEYAEPAVKEMDSILHYSKNNQYGFYFNAIITPWKPLHVNFSLRHSHYQFASSFDYVCIPAFKDAGYCDVLGEYLTEFTDIRNRSYKHTSWPPSVSISYDVTDNLTSYIGYTTIYQERSENILSNGQPAEPLTGANYEIGLKYAAPSGRLNATLAGYKIRRTGDLIPDGPLTSGPNGTTCCFLPGGDRVSTVTGAELEVTGEIFRGFNLFAGYTYSTAKDTGGDFPAEGAAFATRAPKHLLKLWGTYTLQGDVPLVDELSFSLGLNAQSKSYTSGSACIEYVDGDGSPGSPLKVCNAFGPYEFSQPSFAIVSGRIDGKLSENVSLSLNLTNLFDKRYYQTTGGVDSGNWYGEPRSFTVSLRGKW